MSKRKVVFSLVFCLIFWLFCVNVVSAQGFLTLPFEGSHTRTSTFCSYTYDNGLCHGGTDWLMNEGTPILAAADGLASAFSDPASPSYGDRIDIDHGNSRLTRYAHLSSFASGITPCAEPVQVYRGQIIGYAGHTGGPWRQGYDDNGDPILDDPDHLHFEARHNGVAVDPYDENNYLWTTNPPSHGYYNPLTFTFDSASPQGFTCGFDTEEAREPQYGEWRVHVVNNPPTTNPGVVSPEYASGMMALGTVIEFSAKVIGNDVPVNAELYIKHKDGNWNNVVCIGTIGTDHAYHTYIVDLTEAIGDIPIDELEVCQFSLELSDGENGSDEYWYFDWLKVYPQVWNFTTDWAGWSIKRNAEFADFFPADNPYCLRLNPTEKQPQFLSPKINGIASCFDRIAIRYSVRHTDGQQETNPPARIYFDTGAGFSTACFQTSTILCDSGPHVVEFDIPDCARNATQILFDLFDLVEHPDTYEGRQIAIDKIAFLRPEFGAGGSDEYYGDYSSIFESDSYTSDADSTPTDPPPEGGGDTTTSNEDTTVNPSPSMILPFVSGSLGDDWNLVGIGNTYGSADESKNGKFAISSHDGFNHDHRQCLFAHTGQYTEDFAIIARVTHIEGFNLCATAGIMVRESLQLESPRAILSVDNEEIEGKNRIRFEYGSGQNTDHLCELPIWIKLVKHDNQFSGYYSSDAINWKIIGLPAQVTEIGNELYYGFFVAGGGDNAFAKAEIDGFSIAELYYPCTPETELCGDGLDNDCDGDIDEGFNCGEPCEIGIGACRRVGVMVCSEDRLSTICSVQEVGSPTEETCDGVDNDCDGEVDEGIVWYPDHDGDGYGSDDESLAIEICPAPSGYVQNNVDCYDQSRFVHPGLEEVRGNRFDDNCNGVIDEYVVNQSGSGDFTTIQSAINSARGNIVVEDGTYNENVVLDEYDYVNLYSENGPEKTIINGNGNGPTLKFYFWKRGSSETVSGFTITGGSTSCGGGIYCVGSSPTIKDCIITGNSSSYSGGGIFFHSSKNPTLQDCVIQNNESVNGGGITCSYSSGIIKDCVITGNTAESSGGGIYSYASSFTTEDCQITNNHARAFGAGIYIEKCKYEYNKPDIPYYAISSQITNSTISGNEVEFFGGGIYIKEAPVIIQSSQIINNTSNLLAGAIQVYNTTELPIRIDDSTITGNYSKADGTNVLITAPSYQTSGSTMEMNN